MRRGKVWRKVEKKEVGGGWKEIEEKREKSKKTICDIKHSTADDVTACY